MIVGILFIVFVCGAAVGVLIMCFVRGAATLEMSSQLLLKDRLIAEITDDLLEIYVSNNHNYAMSVANKWVGERGELTRF